MKNPFLLFSLTVSVVAALAADPLTEAFQRGLLAEEAQRDLKAAAAAYGEVLQQADAQRELIATALFRLAETQRRLGRTNEALAGFRRLVREFAEQTNLTGLAVARLPEKAAGGPGVQLLEAQLEQAGQLLARTSRDQGELAGFLRQTRALASLGEISSALAARYPSVELQRLRAERNSAEVAAARLSPDFGPQHPEVVRNKTVLAKLDEQLEREITSILNGQDVREQALGADVESQRRVVRLLEAKLQQEHQDGSLPAQRDGPELAGLSRLRSRLAMFESARDDAVAAFNRLTEVARVVAAVKPGQIAAQLHHAPELGELVTEGKILTEGRDSLEAEAAELEGKLGANDAKVLEIRVLLAKQDESLEVLRKRALAAFQTRLPSLGFTLKTMDAHIETLREKLRQAETDALRSGRPADPAGEQRRLLAEEIRVAEEQVAEIRLQGSQGAATQAELLQAQRDVLALKRQLAGLRQPELVELLPAPATAAVPETDEESREIERVRRMLANSPDLINAPKGDPLETPLQTAARLDQARVVEFLLAQKADLNVPTGGRTPLHVAAKAGHKRMVELLLKAGAKVDAQAGDGQTPLHMATAAGHRQVVQALVSAGANLSLRTKAGPTFASLPNGGSVSEVTPMGLAIALGNLPLVELLAAAAANLNEPVANVHGRSQTALTLALQAKAFSLAARLLDLGANPAIEADGVTPMLWAVSTSAPPDLLGRLIEGGARLTAKLEQGQTLLHVAVGNASVEVARWLLAHGVPVDEPNGDGASALWFAVSSLGSGVTPERMAILELLLGAKANPNQANRSGLSPLRLAVDSGQLETVKRLLQAGGDPNQSHPTLGPLLNAAIVRAGRLPMQRARPVFVGAAGTDGGSEQSGSNREFAEALLAAGADPNAEHEGYRLLGHAINLGPEWVQLFLTHRADPNRRPSAGGDTPLEAIQRYRTQGRPQNMTLESLAESERLLRAAGARDDVPDFSAIKVARKSANYVQAVFRSGATNDPNRFTLLELLATHYGEMTAPLAFRGVDVAADGGGLGGPPGFAPAGPPRVGRPGFSQRAGLGFTDWRRVVIYRAARQGLERQELPVDVEALVAADDCSRDVVLEWGDVVELPERDHPVGAAFEGVPAGMEKLWQTCLARTVTITIKGEAKPLKLTVGAETSGSTPGINPFSLMGALRQPGLLRTSSDLRQVRVERPAAPQPLRWQLDCSDSGAAATFWLRDGDVVVVPDLPAGGK